MGFGPRFHHSPLLMYKFLSISILRDGVEIAKFEGEDAKQLAGEFVQTQGNCELDIITHLKMRRV